MTAKRTGVGAAAVRSNGREGLPAVSLVPVPGRWRASLDLACEIERRGFAGIYVPSLGDAMGFCEALALKTEVIPFGTSIVNIYTRHAYDYAQSAATIHELSGGRFFFGVGVSHAPMNGFLGVRAGKPLADMRAFVKAWREAPRVGERPPLVLAALRDPMVKLAGELADGVVFANAARSYLAHSLETFAQACDGGDNAFFADMIPTVVSDDRAAAAARNRKTMTSYAKLPNYRNYWKAAGYREEMEAIEAAVEAGRSESIPSLLSDRWLADCTLFGSATQVREGIEAWRQAGLRTPIVVPSSASGNQMKAFEELFAAFA